MRSRRFSLWQKAAALAPALLLLAYLPAQMMLRCRIDGLLRPACCCPHASEPESSAALAKASGQDDCCDREVAEQLRPRAEAASPTVRDPGPMAAAAIFVSDLLVSGPSVDGFDRAAQRHGPAREGPRIILLKSAFLI